MVPSMPQNGHGPIPANSATRTPASGPVPSATIGLPKQGNAILHCGRAGTALAILRCEPQKGYCGGVSLYVTHCHWVNSSQLAGPP